MAKSTEEKSSFGDKVRQFGTVFTFARQRDRWFLLWLIGAFVLTLGVGLTLAFFTRQWLIIAPLSVLLALLVTMLVFGRRVTKATYNEVEGKPGAAAAIMQNMRGVWRITPAAAVTPHQDLVHRAIGRPGVVLVIEGSVQRLRNMITQEKKRIHRIAPHTPIYEVVVGDGEGEVSIRKLQTHLMRLPRNISREQIHSLEDKLSMLRGTRPPMPKAPLPKNVRMPKIKMQRR